MIVESSNFDISRHILNEPIVRVYLLFRSQYFFKYLIFDWLIAMVRDFYYASQWSSFWEGP